MKVILKQDIPNLGDAGEVKNVADGYARNYLIPKKLVIPFNESSKKALEHQKRLIEIKKQKKKEDSSRNCKKLRIIRNDRSSSTCRC